MGKDLDQLDPKPWMDFDDQCAPDLGLHTPTCTKGDWKHKDVELIYGTGIAYIVFNRPKAKNSVSDSLRDGFNDAVAALHQSTDIRVVVLCARGTMFCSGDDIKWREATVKRLNGEQVKDDGASENGKVDMKPPSEEVAKNIEEMKERVWKAGAFDKKEQMALLPECKDLWNLSSLPMLVVGVANGSVIGSGMGYIGACDLVITVESANFVLSEIKSGIVSTATPFLCAKGSNKAATLMLMGETVTAQEALDIGFVQYVVKDKEAAQKKLEEICASVQQLSPDALTQTKRFTFGCAGRFVNNELVWWSMKNLQHALNSKDFKESVAAAWAKKEIRAITPPPWN